MTARERWRPAVHEHGLRSPAHAEQLVARRVFEHRRTWSITRDSLHEATALLAQAALADHGSIAHVIGIANGGITPAGMIASATGARPHIVRARHNIGDSTYQQATGIVHLDLEPLHRSLNRQRLTGRVLLVDDICGSGATLHLVRRDLAPLLSSTAQLLTAVLCLNAGASTLPDYSIWTVSDWVVFPWEPRPDDTATTPLSLPEEVVRHA